jgi:hypothetical protein
MSNFLPFRGEEFFSLRNLNKSLTRSPG